MKLSTKGRYGIRAMLDLAINYEKGFIPLKQIAKRQDISEHYLEQLISILRKAGLVKSVRGAQGGYQLSEEPSNITVGEVLKALEGSLAPVECVQEKDPVDCPKAQDCVTRSVWERVRNSINEVVDNITLQDLVEDYKKARRGYMYYI